jgi:phosphatidylglycerophosphatase A
LRFLNYLWATWFGSGYAPVAPGTAGSLAALPFVWAFAALGRVELAFFAVFTFITGVMVSNYISKDKTADDPQIVVIDEVCGQAIAFLLIPSDFLEPATFKFWFIALISFAFFRLFDVWKPWPASFFDSKMHNGWGMMLDDVAAGVYAMFATYGAVKIYPIIF